MNYSGSIKGPGSLAVVRTLAGVKVVVEDHRDEGYRFLVTKKMISTPVNDFRRGSVEVATGGRVSFDAALILLPHRRRAVGH